ncbi:MAG: Ig-like domain-containing protein [Lachnospiraceae bacterium]|nr:Ig-like domain-containing protein [Lachnospiraceae bacterium]
MRKKLFTFIWALIFILSITVFANSQTAEAANSKAVKSVDVRIDNKKFSKKTYMLEIGKSKSLKVSASPKQALKGISYKSKNTKIVTVNKKGKITAKKKGTSKIEVTVTGKNNKKKSTWVKIKTVYPEIKSVSIKIDTKTVSGKTYSLKSGKSKKLKVSVMPKNAVKTITYKSNNTKIATVSKEGKVTAKRAGTAKIMVIAVNKDNRKKSAWVNIKVTESNVPTPNPGTSNILIAYFSLADNVADSDEVDASTSASIVVDNSGQYGTTEYIARMIQQNVGGDLHKIQTKETYPNDFDMVVDKNHQEMQNGTLPELVESNLDISQYDTVFIGYPVWATNAPQAILSFLKEYDLSGKKVIPFCTHDGYGAGSSYRTISNACPQATVLEGLAIQANDVHMAEEVVSNWLTSIGVVKPSVKETAIKITVGSNVLDGVIYDTALAEEFKEQFPLTVSMSGYGGREYYGGLNFTPKTIESGKLNFENGDITYCRTNNTMAIFYDKTKQPNLTMEVVSIGKVTSDLKVFESLNSREDITFSLADDKDMNKNKVLVAYFSATNTTEKLAGYLADGLNADLHEIVPAVPYTSEDLNYGDSSSRTSIEMNDANARPEISGSVTDIGQYDIVFIGYPIWWGQAPKIISTFLESYDFSGKTIIPFCTSGSSGIGSSATNLHSLTDGANWLSGRRFGSSASRSDMVNWVNELELDIIAE